MSKGRLDRRLTGEKDRARLLEGLPVVERRLSVAGVSTSILEGGDGPPLILLHGAIECGGAVWAPVVAQLARSHRLVIPDLPGLGESEPMARLDATAFENWFTELLRLTCPEKPTLIAHSMAGSLAVRFAAQHGELLRQLVIYAGPGIGPYRLPLGLMVVAIRFGLRPTDTNSERFERWAFFDLDHARQQNPTWLAAFGAYNFSRAVVPHVKATMRQLIKTGKKQVPDLDLRGIKIPTALIWGRHDRFVPLDLAERASNRYGWPLHLIDEAGHVPHIEQPEAFLGVLAKIEPAVRGGKAETP